MPPQIALAPKERRIAQRAPSRLKARIQLRRVSEDGAWVAMVRNISCQGVGFVLNRPVKPGMILAVELPTKPRHPGSLYLVRVMRVEAQPGGEWWYVGGSFSQKLTKLEVNALRSRTPSLIPQHERRTTVRHTTRIKTPVPLVRAIEEGPWQATVRNVTPRGLGFIANRPFKPGSVLTIELPTRSGKLTKPHLLKVTHANRQDDSPWWVMGGAFLLRLTPEEFELLV